MLQGSLVALVTPMLTDDHHAIDESNLRRLIDFHIAQGTDGIVVAGTTGESATLTHEENCNIIRFVVDYVGKRVPVIGGTGSNSTAEAIYLTEEARKAGVDACLLVTPYYNKPTQEGLYQHYRKVAEAVDVPILLYNVPGRTACDLLPATVKRLAEIDNIVGVKEALGDMARVSELMQFASDDFAIYSGDDATAMELMLMGGRGVISVTANVAPKAMHTLCEYALAGDRAKAEQVNQQLMGLNKHLFVEANPIPVKWALHIMGMISPAIRLPLTPLSPQYHDVVTAAMHQAGVL